MPPLKVKKIHPEAILPFYAHLGDAGMDIRTPEEVTVEPGEVAKVKAGIALEIPDGYVALCWDKSSLGMNHQIKTIGGVIDSSYRGEVIVGVINLGKTAYTFKKGEKVTQILIQKVERPEVEEVSELSETSRGEGGFGSTGK